MLTRTVLVTVLLLIVALCLLGQALSRHYGFFRDFQATLRSVDWMLLACLSVWCGTLLFLTFSRRDWPLIGLLLVAGVHYITGTAESSQFMDALILLAGVTLGRGAHFALKGDGRWKMGDEAKTEARSQKSEARIFLIGLIGLMTFAAWWHLEPTGAYHGPRWIGLWNNPNIYGILMGAGVVLSTGLLLEDRRWKIEDGEENAEWKAGRILQRITENWKSVILVIAVGMMAVGLVMSYSRGAWTATVVALLYLTWSYGKLKWRYVGIGVGLLALGVGLVWGNTSDSAPWYLKRADLGRPSAQHRVSAWRGAVQMMRDYPLGVGWNQAVSVYDKSYSPPEGGAAALTMNSYLMLGTELGLPGLVCFVAYVGLCFRRSPRLHLTKNLNLEKRIPHPGPLPIGSADSAEAETEKLVASHSSLRAACLAGALVFVVAIWFDGGLFDLPTTAMFWVLIELGVSRGEEG